MGDGGCGWDRLERFRRRENRPNTARAIFVSNFVTEYRMLIHEHATECAELLKMDLSAQALWQEKHTFSLTKSQYLVECSRARQDVLVRSGHGAGRARMRVPTCSARPAPRYAVLYRFHFSARRAPARGIGDFFSETKAAYFIVHLRDA